MQAKCASTTLVALALLSVLSVPCWSSPVAFNSAEGGTYMVQREGAATAEAAVLALLQGPAKMESAAGIWTAIPKGTKLLSVDILDKGVLVNLSAEAAVGLDDATWETMQQQFIWTMKPLGLEEMVKVLIDGKEPTSYMPEPGPALYSAPSDDEVSTSAIELGDVGLSGKRVTVSAGHGHYWNGSAWYYERGTSCGYEQEDIRNVRFGKYLRAHLENDGAYVQIVREDNLNRGTGPSNVPWFHEGSYIWCRDQSYSCSVWANATGRCTDIVGPTRLSDSIRARPLASNLDDRGNTDVFIDIHSNAYQGDCYGTSCPSGPDGYYCNDNGHQTWGAQSISLAQKVQDQMLAAVQAAGYSMGHHGG
ncbi:MAG TPA: GerMN domain-containing protein, partial [bacterium]|nr:GerMN domain-containing protein [bacterium]